MDYGTRISLTLKQVNEMKLLCADLQSELIRGIQTGRYSKGKEVSLHDIKTLVWKIGWNYVNNLSLEEFLDECKKYRVENHG